MAAGKCNRLHAAANSSREQGESAEVSIVSNKRRLASTISAFAVALSVGIAEPAHAQLTTATIRGTVTNSAAAAPSATVTAKSVETGAVARATAGPDGSYVLTGLSPGSYDVTFTAAGGAPVTQRVIVSVGQTASLDMDVAAPAASAAEAGPPATPARGGGAIVVTGRRLVETRTSEVATNVTQQQIENLPQSNRNFLNFAQLAPGIRLVQSGDLRQTFAGGGVGENPNGESFGGPQVNVFIDGVSLKSNVQQGGIVGQDVSAGNPFSQLAIREFRVLTSNFKAEYEDAGTSIITAVTKSGTNEFHGEAFGLFSNDKLIARDFFQKKNNQSKNPLKRWQYGAALGGPIIKDKLFFFANYEANIKDRNANVVPGTPPDAQGPLIGFDPQDFAGTFVSPFREHLGFGKLTFLPTDNNTLELSGSIRKETDNRDFGGQNAVSRGTHVDNDVYTIKLEDRHVGNGFLNEATVDWLKYDLAFGAQSTTDFGRTYQGVISVGSRADFQHVVQEGLTFRDNLSFTNLHWNGDHLVKIGGKLSFQKYKIGGTGPFANPQFEFVFDPTRNLDFSFPDKVNFGGGNPNVTAKTTQIGLFAQDDWQINPHLLINAGVRWDVDTNAKNKNFVTPQKAVEALLALGADPRIQPAFFDVNDYISTGDNRDTDWNNFAPRVGFSYDLNADQRTVFFGGYGRYYDRALFRSAAEETLLSQFQQGEILFSKDGLPRNGQPTVLFDPSFLTPAGFEALLASLSTNPLAPGTSELRVIPNDLKTPYTDQFSIGVRQRLGILRTSLTFNHTIGKDQIGYAPLNRSAVPNSASGFFDFIPMINGYGSAVAAFNTRETKYNAIFATLDKPYSKESGWGLGVAYTFVLDSEENGNPGGGGFNFDRPNIAATGFVPNAGYEKHRLVINGMVDLPFDSMLSGLITYGSGAPFFVIDALEGFQPDKIKLGYFNHLPHFLQVDLRLQKFFRFGDDREFGISAEVFNLFNRANFGGADGFICCGGNPNFGVPNSLSGPPRTIQFGANVKF
jgi:outer membrane receptor protein involved in Fe transport